ncbi:MAG: PLDc N-terminal domain-containing protein [Parabacteroides sp.]|nr:PLDc N-terminal domain-containing protein [Parabacteroides sp.]
MLAAIYVQIQWIVGLIFIILYAVTTVSVILVIVAENRNPLKTISWVIVLLFAPVIGLLAYCFLGQDNRKLRVISRRAYKRINLE